MIQEVINNDAFEPEILEYITLKSKASRYVYSSAFKHFLDFYRNKYGKDKTISHFLDRIFDEFKKERRKQIHTNFNLVLRKTKGKSICARGLKFCPQHRFYLITTIIQDFDFLKNLE